MCISFVKINTGYLIMYPVDCVPLALYSYILLVIFSWYHYLKYWAFTPRQLIMQNIIQLSCPTFIGNFMIGIILLLFMVISVSLTTFCSSTGFYCDIDFQD